MTADEWRSIKTLAGEALTLPDEARPAFLAQRCGADAWLHREVLALLASTAEATHLFEAPVITMPGALAVLARAEEADVNIGRRLGPYKIVRPLGRGGMGAAYLAERDDHAYTKRVAIKVIKRGMDTDAVLRRFLHERQILANLSHANIATLLDGGATDDGLPYFVMEYVDGLPIDAYCDFNTLSIPQRLALFQAVCAAVQYAHDNRIIHRDLKPANILVTSAGAPKLLDFGIAKLLDAEPALQTMEGTQLVRAMTPEYASPEQVRGHRITPSSDVYSLGVLLYELLCGTHPYALAGLTPHEAEKVICEVAPPRPSTVIDAEIAPSRSTDTGTLRRQLAGDLDTITLTALRKEPDRRYGSAKALADDIQRHLDGLAIAAPSEGIAARLAALIRGARHTPTNRLMFVSGLAAAMLLVAILGLGGRFSGSTAAIGPIQSLAVLPLSSTGAETDLEYLSDGITENVINRLSGISRLKVIARDSAYRYKGKPVDPRAIGRDLGVQAIVTGRIVHRGNDLSLSAELIDARDGTHLWGEQYERRIDDVHLLSIEVAQRIAERLQVSLSRDERTRVGRTDSRSAEAYQLYLKGRYFWNRRTSRDLTKSIDYFRRAVEREPLFAPAHAALADSYGLLTEYHALPARQTYREAKAAALKALEIDGELAEAHTSRAYVSQFYEWDWPAAEREYQRALALNPNYATAHQWYAEYLSAMGRHDEALAQIRRAQALDPLSLIINSVEAHLLYMARRYDESIEASLRVIDMDPNFPEVYEYLKRAYDQQGAYAEAIKARQARRRLLGRDVTETPALRAAASTTDARVYWRKRVEQELRESSTEGLYAYEMAELLAQAGDVPRALDSLEKACADDDFMIMYIKVAPNLDPLRQEARFLGLLQRRCGV